MVPYDWTPPLPPGAPEGTWFDHKAAQKACEFFPRFLRHTEGQWAGKPFKLTEWQEKRIIRPLFGWKRADGLRLIRTLYLEIARKNGKTELCAGVALLCLLGDAEIGGQGFSGAVDKDQAKIVFEKASKMISMSEDLGRHLEVFKNSIFCPELMAHFKPLSAAPHGKHGFSPTFAVYDEIHVWIDGELAQVVHDGMAAREQPIEMYATTAGIKGVGFGWEMHDRAVKVLDGTLIDPTFLAVIFAAPDDADFRDPKTWALANPNLGISPRLDFMAAQAREAAESPRKENNFRRYHLNQWTEQITRWLSFESWQACAGEIGWQDLAEAMAGRICWGGVDLSTKVDLSARVLVFPPAEGETGTVLLPRFYLPEDNVERAEKRDRLPYRRWAEEGALRLTPGNVIDYAFIEQDLRDDADRYEIRDVGYDPWNATQFAVRMQTEGMTMVEFRQGYQSMSEPSKELERLVIAGKLRHGGHPLLAEMAKAVSIINDPAGNIKPDKSKAMLRIDGIVAAIIALGRSMDPGEADGPSFWETLSKPASSAA